ncbi:YqaI family protein [Planococcus halotolerans]|uniref:YqaI family protein n=1 Tax=Planococcus halotolerans TaxID=2233542 RepID=UPI001F0BD7B6|nr:hypothetical protein [Planococcus halotolerans]
MRNVESMQEYIDTRDFEVRLKNLSERANDRILSNVISHICWHGPITRTWMEDEISSQELIENESLKHVVDHPIEDHFGSEIRTGDKWFQDGAGRVVLENNIEDYLIEVARVEFCRAIE